MPSPFALICPPFALRYRRVCEDFDTSVRTEYFFSPNGIFFQSERNIFQSEW